MSHLDNRLASSVPCRAGAAHETSGFGARVFAVLQHLPAVDKNVNHAGGILVGLREGCVILDLLRIENNHVCKVPLLQHPTTLNPEVLRGQRRKLPDRFLQLQYLLLAHVPAQEPGKAAVSPRVYTALQKNPLRSN